MSHEKVATCDGIVSPATLLIHPLRASRSIISLFKKKKKETNNNDLKKGVGISLSGGETFNTGWLA